MILADDRVEAARPARARRSTLALWALLASVAIFELLYWARLKCGLFEWDAIYIRHLDLGGRRALAALVLSGVLAGVIVATGVAAIVAASRNARRRQSIFVAVIGAVLLVTLLLGRALAGGCVTGDLVLTDPR